MKKYLILLVMSLVSLQSWADISYGLRYNPTTDMFEVFFTSTVTYPVLATISSSQATLAFDPSFNTEGLSAASVVSVNGGAWTPATKVTANAGTLDTKKVVGFSTNGAAIAGGVVAGTQYPLFSFTFGTGANCSATSTLRLFVNGVDLNDPDGTGGDFTSYLGIGGDDLLSTNTDIVFKNLCAESNPTPVRFLSFTAIKSGNAAVLNWNVANEDPTTRHYELERSTNRVDFTIVATVAAKNNGQGNNKYDFTDPNLSGLRSSGLIYYRLKQVDNDGNFVYSEIRIVRLNGNGFGASVFPNPARDFTSVTIDLEQAFSITMRVTDASGKEMKRIVMPGIKGTNVKKIDLSGFASGSYMLNVLSGKQSLTIPLVKGR